MKGARPLTEGEIAMAREVFGDAIDLAPVRVVRRKWWPFQPRNVVMAPTGHVHFHHHSPHWSEDFSLENLKRQGLLIHELTHVWQAQQRGRFYLPLMRHPFCRYDYELVPGRKFSAYGLEQQAEIVKHAFYARRGVTLDREMDPDILPFQCGR